MFVQFKETYPCFITKENKTKKKKKYATLSRDWGWYL